MRVLMMIALVLAILLLLALLVLVGRIIYEKFDEPHPGYIPPFSQLKYEMPISIKLTNIEYTSTIMIRLSKFDFPRLIT